MCDKNKLDFSRPGTITGNRKFDGTPKAIFTSRFIRESRWDIPADVSILALEGSLICPLTVASEVWKHLVQTVDGLSESIDEKYEAYRVANFCLRILILKFPGYFDSEDLLAAATIVSFDYFDGEKPIEGIVLQFVRAYKKHAPLTWNHYDPVRHFGYEMDCVRSEGMMGRIVEMFQQLVVLRKPVAASH